MAIEDNIDEEEDIGQDDIPPIPIDRRFTIYPGTPEPQFHASPAMAYKVVDNEHPENPYHALVCDPKLHPRLSIIEPLTLISKTNRNVITPEAWTIMYWEAESRECPVLIMNSGRLVPFTFSALETPMTEELIVQTFLRHTIEMLTDFETRGIAHRAIRLDNIFYFNELKRRIILGECISTPPGLTQSKLYDTIDNALAVPLGKGDRMASDDIYALGVVVLSMINNRDLSRGMSEDELVSRKMMYGTFDALHEPKVRLSSTMETALRMMLNDDVEQRANLRELQMWLNGQNFIYDNDPPQKRSSKPFTIAHKNFFTARELAKGMHENWDASAKISMSEEFTDWVQNNLSETAVTLNYVKSVKDFDGWSTENQHRLLGRVILALHDQGPIRYRSFSATIDGITRLISHFIHNDEARQIFRELMGSGIIDFWFDLHKEENEALSSKMFKMQETFKNYIEELRKDSTIEGLNLLVYEFNKDLPCQSKRFERYFVYRPSHLLPAIESILENEKDFDSLLDYQIICFLKARYSRSIRKEVRTYMIHSVPEESCVAEAEILAKLQADFYPNREFTLICEKLCELLEPAVKRHHSRSMRRATRKEMKHAASRGQIRRIVQIVSDKAVIDHDVVNFNLARAEYASLLQEIGFVDFNLKNLSEMVARIGGDISSSVSGILASIVTLGYVSYWSLFH